MNSKTTSASKRLLLPILVTLLIVTGFQVYWIIDNYRREEKTLLIKTNMAFRESIFELQAVKLNSADKVMDSNDHRTLRVIVNDAAIDKQTKQPDLDDVEMINVLNDQERDSGHENKIFVSMNHRSMWNAQDSIKFSQEPDKIRNKVIRILAGVDSLQDSLSAQEIRRKFDQKLKEEKIAIPFSIGRLSYIAGRDRQPVNEVKVGFGNPIVYRMQPGNTFPYLLKKISGPVIFSFFLISFTILSFILLYRSLVKQQRLAAMKNEFISNITHELKTPVATVSVAIEALRNFNAVEDREKTTEYLAISAAELQRLSLLIDKVLKLSLFENKEMELKKENFDLLLMVNEVLNSMKLQFEQQDAKVDISAEGVDFMIVADRLHLISLVYNLLDNALKYSPDSPQISIRLKAVHREIIELQILDHGIGIPGEYQSKVFDKFFRVPRGNDHSVKGYGLGLSYVAEIVKRHRGLIEVKSANGKGTVFTIRLPRQELSIIRFDDKRVNYKIQIPRSLFLKSKKI